MRIYLFFVIAYICEVLGQNVLLNNVRETTSKKYMTQCGTRNVAINSYGRENFPWLVKLLYNHNKVSPCGGVLIDYQWVLSSAKCIKSDELQAVMVGEYDTTSTWDCVCTEYKDTLQKVYIDKKILNEIFDFGLLKLIEPVRINDYVIPMCIPLTDHFIFPDVIGRVAGWSYAPTDNLLYKEELQSTRMVIINNTVCNQILNTTLPSYKFCAKQIGKLLPCVPMPGGPFMEYWPDDGRFYAVGIMLKEGSECDATKPIVFLKTRLVRYWIRNSITDSM